MWQIKRKNPVFIVRRKDQKISVKRKQNVNLVLFIFKGQTKRGVIWSFNHTFDFYVIKSRHSYFTVPKQGIISGL